MNDANSTGKSKTDALIRFIEERARLDAGAGSAANVDVGVDMGADANAYTIAEASADAETADFSDAITAIYAEAETDEGAYEDFELSVEAMAYENEDDEFSDENNKVRMELYDWMQCIVSAIVCGIFIFVFIGRTIGVEGNSMLQTLHWNDRVIMSGLFYTPKNGDIIIFRPPTEAFGSTPLVKRVIALEGQTIDINFETGEVFVDGFVVDEERYINEPTHSRLSFAGPVTVPEGHVFVMGDNRNHSSDSRDSRVGMVDTRYILGKVLFLLIPGEISPNQRDWRRIGMVS